MEIILGLLTSLMIPVAVVAGIVFLVRRSRGNDEEDEVDDGIGGVRRAFLYGLAFVALMFAGSGIAMLLGGIVEAVSGDRVIADSDTQLAMALAFTVVGAPAWLIFAALAQRSLTQHAVEARSGMRWTYFGAVRAVALLITLVRGVDALEALLGEPRVDSGAFEGGAWGWFLTWAAIWALHELLARRERPTARDALTLDRLYHSFGAAVGLYVFGAGLTSSLALAGSRAYDALTSDTLVERGGWADGTALAVLVLGGATWWWHWLTCLRRERPSASWDIHVFLFGIFTGVAVAVSASATLLFLVLEWTIGDPGPTTAIEHFRNTVPALAFLAIGAASWTYYRLLLTETREEEPRRARTEPERVYRYLIAAAGLVTLGTGLAIVIAMAVDAVTPATGVFRQGEWWRDELAMAITALVVGVPLWARAWFAAQAIVATGGVEEVSAPSRRVFIFGVFGVAILVAIVNLIILLFEFFDAVLGEGISTTLIRDVRWAIAMLVTAGAIAAYHWLVLREQQGAGRDDGPTAPAGGALREVVLIGGGASATALRDALAGSDVRVRVWRRIDLDATDLDATPVTDTDAEVLRERLLASDHPRVAVIFGEGVPQIVPFEVDG